MTIAGSIDTVASVNVAGHRPTFVVLFTVFSRVSPEAITGEPLIETIGTTRPIVAVHSVAIVVPVARGTRPAWEALACAIHTPSSLGIAIFKLAEIFVVAIGTGVPSGACTISIVARSSILAGYIMAQVDFIAGQLRVSWEALAPAIATDAAPVAGRIHAVVAEISREPGQTRAEPVGAIAIVDARHIVAFVLNVAGRPRQGVRVALVASAASIVGVAVSIVALDLVTIVVIFTSVPRPWILAVASKRVQHARTGAAVLAVNPIAMILGVALRAREARITVAGAVDTFASLAVAAGGVTGVVVAAVLTTVTRRT